MHTDLRGHVPPGIARQPRRSALRALPSRRRGLQLLRLLLLLALVGDGVGVARQQNAHRRRLLRAQQHVLERRLAGGPLVEQAEEVVRAMKYPNNPTTPGIRSCGPVRSMGLYGAEHMERAIEAYMNE